MLPQGWGTPASSGRRQFAKLLPARAGASLDAEVISSDQGKAGTSVKARIQSVLSGLDKPVSSSELWELCQVCPLLRRTRRLCSQLEAAATAPSCSLRQQERALMDKPGRRMVIASTQ